MAVLNFLNSVSAYYGLGQAAANVGGGLAMPHLGMPAIVPQLPLAFGGGGGGVHMHLNGDIRDVRQMQQEDRENDRAKQAACIGGLCAIACSALSAFTLRDYCNNRDALREAEEFRDDVLPHAELRGNDRALMNLLLNEHIRNVEAKCSRSRNIVILTGLALGTAITGFLGGMFAIQAMITAAIIAAIAIACVTAFLVVWYCTAKVELSHANQAQLEALKQHLRA
jgi:hypothetical protein